MNKTCIALTLLFAAMLAANPVAVARNANSDWVGQISDAIHNHTDKAPASAEIESGFSPDGGSEQLVVKVINSAQNTIRLAAYSFTSPTVVRALLAAKKRGVEIKLVVDERGNKSKSSQAAMNLLVNADIPIRTIGKYAIHHDKFIVADDRHVQTGSFNYSQAAAKTNSENVLVVWHNPDLAASYLRHWQSRYDDGVDVKSTY